MSAAIMHRYWSSTMRILDARGDTTDVSTPASVGEYPNTSSTTTWGMGFIGSPSLMRVGYAVNIRRNSPSYFTVTRHMDHGTTVGTGPPPLARTIVNPRHIA